MSIARNEPRRKNRTDPGIRGDRRRPRRRADTPPPLILVVDDEPGTLAGMAELLDDVGYRVQTAADGVEALATIDRQRPDLIISDVRMPRMNVLQLASRLRATRDDGRVRVILMSAYGEPVQRARGLDEGADDYVVKPIDVDDLLARIRVQLRAAERERILLLRADVDELTGLLNRRGVLRALDRELDRLQAAGEGLLSVILIDVNGFKRINDRHGHIVGDVVLRRVAKALSVQVRTDDVLGRLGGDEFLVVAPGLDPGGAALMVHRLGELHDVPGARSLGLDHAVTVSAGAASASPGEAAHQLIQRADEQMYRNKRDQGT